MKQTEIFKPINSFLGLYKIGSKGTVISIGRKINNGNGYRLTNDYKMKQYDNGHGYLRVCLRDDNRQKFYLVHRLIAEHFIPNPKNYLFVNHIDGNKRNNDISNLEWCTPSYNNSHALYAGLRKSSSGERHGKAKLTDKKVIEIRRILFLKEMNQRQVAEKYNVSSKTINQIFKRKIWKHL